MQDACAGRSLTKREKTSQRLLAEVREYTSLFSVKQQLHDC